MPKILLFPFYLLFMLVKIYKHETILSVAEVEAPTEAQAIRYARAAVGMDDEPKYQEQFRRNPRLSLSGEKEKGTTDKVTI